MKIKYSILIFKASYAFKSFGEKFYFDENTFLKSGRLSDLTALDFEETWKKWLGTTRWKELSSYCDEFIVSWQPFEQVHEYDDEGTSRLDSKLSEIYRCLPTVTSHCFSFSELLYLVSGEGAFADGEIRINDISSLAFVNSHRRSAWLSTEENYEDPLFEHNKVLEKWRSNFLKIQDKVFIEKNRQLLEAFRSLDEGARTLQLEFKLPNLIRSIESLIDCNGAKDFSEKVMQFAGVPPEEDVFKIHDNYKEKLKMLYYLRNDCSHGKPFAYSLDQHLGRASTNYEIYCYEFLLEWLARRVFECALDNNQVKDMYLNRDNLVAGCKKIFKKV